MSDSAHSRRSIVEAALGGRPADLVITNGTLMDVYSGRRIPNRSVAVRDRWISYVGPDSDHVVGEGTQILDAKGRFLCPGYIDAHTHLASYWNIADFLSYAVPCGVTSFVTEVESYPHAAGVEGFKAFLDQIENRPVKMYGLIPPMISASRALERMYITRQQARELLKDDRVLGLGESYWQGTILVPDDRVLDLVEETLRAGKTVEGHAAGAKGRKLSAYAAMGASSCHEAISTEDVLDRLELGIYAMIREGDIRDDLEIILPLKDKLDLRRVVLVTDGTNPSMLLDRGYLVDVVQRAVDLGFDPVQAAQMVSLNPAEHFGIHHITGGIAPGRCADILLLPGERVMRPDVVISNGRIVAEHGKMTVPISRRPHPEALYRTVRVDAVSVSDLSVPVPATRHPVRVIEIQPGGLVTREGRAEPGAANGAYRADPEKDLLKIAFFERSSGKAERFVGFVRGWGQKKGGAATTACWDASGILAVGADDSDMACAVNRVIELGGGTVLCAQGRVLVEIPFPVAGYVSNLPIEEVAARLSLFQNTMRDLGSGLRFAHLTMGTLSTTAIPFIRMSEKGYFRFRENDVVAL